jgi:hypothetical protein
METISQTIYDTPVSQKVGFTTGSEFELTGSEYIGYYNVFNNQAYAGKFNRDIPLRSFDNIDTRIILDKDKNFDRVVEDEILLPFELNDILFQPNEIVNKNTLNLKITQLYDNFLEVFRYGKFPSPKIPVNFTGYAILSSDGPASAFANSYIKWIPTNTALLSSNSNSPSFGNYNEAFENTRDFNLDTLKNKFDDKYTIFLSASTTIFSYEVDDPGIGEQHTTFNFIASAKAVGDFESLTFNKISNTANNNLNTLFVADSGNNTITKLDVSSIVNLDRTGIRQFKYIEQIGGDGNNETNFKRLEKIIYGGGFLYSFDSTEKVIKQFTEDLVFIKKYVNNKLFTNNKFVNFAYNPFNRYIYILFDNKKIVVLDTEYFEKIDEYVLDTNFNDEKLEKIIFSENSSNIYYVQTNFGVYKYLLSRKSKLIAEWQLLKNVSQDIAWEETNSLYENTLDNWEGFMQGPDNFNYIDIDILPSKNNFDKLVFMSTKNILEYSENEEFLTLFSRDNPDLYDLDEITFDFEYFNSVSLNIALYKLLYNHNLLASRISKKVSIKFDRGKKVFNNISHLNAEEKLKISLSGTENFYVGVNETISTLVFNRVLKSFYDYQIEILKLLQVEIANLKNPALSTITF